MEEVLMDYALTLALYAQLRGQGLLEPVGATNRPFAAIACVDPRYRKTLEEEFGKVAKNAANYLGVLPWKGGAIRLSNRHECSTVYIDASAAWVSDLYSLFGQNGMDVFLLTHGPDCKFAEHEKLSQSQVFEALEHARLQLTVKQTEGRMPADVRLRLGIIVDSQKGYAPRLLEITDALAASSFLKKRELELAIEQVTLAH